tara:strand:+ start:629 stop:1300 length:672 start_codon:yes stop_codon:yes gene_type:complete
MIRLITSFIFKLFLTACLLSGCSQFNYLSPSYSSTYDLLINRFTDKESIINKSLIDNIPYASSLISFGNNNKSLIILESAKENKNTWISSDKIKIIESNGRVLRSIGLPNDLYSIQRPELNFNMIIEEGKFSYIAYYSFRNPLLNSLKVEVQSIKVGKEVVEILGLKKELILIEENLYSPAINWSAKNKFWYDPATDFVWKSRQFLSPKLPFLDIEVTKKPAI